MGRIAKRRHTRHDVKDIRGSLLFTIDVSVVNMSVDGMAIESKKRLNVGRNYILKLSHDNKSLKLTGRVVWCNLSKALKGEDDSVVPIYNAGIEFENVISDKVRDIVGFMEENVIIKLENRMFGRFKVRPKKSVNLDSEFDFHVKKISLSGMLIETELLPDLESIFDMEININGTGINIQGRIAYINQIGEKEFKRELSELGVEFKKFGEGAKEILEDFILNELENN
ncbi:MAG: PilZ domain-containing protein [Nitrospirota bacterium]|nr:MAG: PilZ domain-containing protein [Nitrospirota bacterium]